MFIYLLFWFAPLCSPGRLVWTVVVKVGVYVGSLWASLGLEICGKFLENLRSFEVFKVKG
jgi:hypothetical protein